MGDVVFTDVWTMKQEDHRMTQTQAFFVETYIKRRLAGLGRQDWRWRAVSRFNGQILASGEGYARKADMMDTIRLLFGSDVRVVHLTIGDAL